MNANYRGDQHIVTLLRRCRQLRQQCTDAEKLLWRLLRGCQIGGVKFRRQHQFGLYIVDFYCAEPKVAIEVDGGQHLNPREAARDTARTGYLEARGVLVLRFTNREVLQEPEAVLQAIWQAIADPHPNPLPLGEGSL